MRQFLWPAVLYGLIWAASLWYVVTTGGESAGGPLFVLAVFGIAFPAVTHVLTLRLEPFPTTWETSWLEPLAILALLGAIVLYLVYGVSFVEGQVEALAPDSGLAMLLAKTFAKLIVFVALPFILMSVIIRHPLSSFGWQAPVWHMLNVRHVLLFIVLAAVFCLFQYNLDSGAAPVREGVFTQDQLMIGLPIVFAWLLIEVGLVEEFFFRGIVQARLAVFLRNEWAALFIASLVFALAHVPGLVLRGAENGDPWLLTANAILMLSAASITFGYIWMRTRNLLVLMMLHAAADLLPNFAGLSQTFGLT